MWYAKARSSKFFPMEELIPLAHTPLGVRPLWAQVPVAWWTKTRQCCERKTSVARTNARKRSHGLGNRWVIVDRDWWKRWVQEPAVSLSSSWVGPRHVIIYPSKLRSLDLSEYHEVHLISQRSEAVRLGMVLMHFIHKVFLSRNQV